MRGREKAVVEILMVVELCPSFRLQGCALVLPRLAATTSYSAAVISYACSLIIAVFYVQACIGLDPVIDETPLCEIFPITGIVTRFSSLL
jgi:hypothetical protein